jgi:molecular chaperone DnaK (HSP70)
MSIVKKISDPKIFSRICKALKIPTQPIKGQDFSYNLNWNGKEFEKGDYPDLIKATSDKLKSLMEKTEYQGQVSLKGKVNDTTISLSELNFNHLEIPEEKKSNKEIILKENEDLKERMKQNRERLKEINRKEEGEKMEKEITEKIKKIYEKKLEEEKEQMNSQIQKIKKALRKTIQEDESD